MIASLYDPHRIAERTPADRYRYADLLRVGSILLVVTGHWLVAVVLMRDGELVTGQLLRFVPETQALTWIFQVMPLFFLVGGYVNAGSWTRARAAGEPWALWLRRRSRRLLGPLLPLLALWVPVAVTLAALGLPEEFVALATQTAFIPLWFLVVYLGINALVPLTWALHRRVGLPAIAVTAVLIAMIDQLHRAEVPYVGFANYVFVWGAAHQLGYLWFDDRLPTRPARSLGLAAAGGLSAMALVTVGGYPFSMVAVEYAGDSNTDPPTIALFTHTLLWLGLVLAVRGPAERWLQRPRVWAPVALGGSVIMSVFLWHMTALVIVAVLTHPTGLWPETSRIDGTWWAFRPLWLALCALVLAGLVAAFRRFEEVADPVPKQRRLRTTLGLAATIVGLGIVLTEGIYQADTGIPWVPIGLLLIGLGSLGVLRPRHDPAERS
jgi:hypothetical protein